MYYHNYFAELNLDEDTCNTNIEFIFINVNEIHIFLFQLIN